MHSEDYTRYLEKVIIGFWRSKRPLAFKEFQHLECFAVNCVTRSEKQIALAASRILKARKSKRQRTKGSSHN